MIMIKKGVADGGVYGLGGDALGWRGGKVVI